MNRSRLRVDNFEGVPRSNRTPWPAAKTQSKSVLSFAYSTKGLPLFSSATYHYCPDSKLAVHIRRELTTSDMSNEQETAVRIVAAKLKELAGVCVEGSFKMDQVMTNQLRDLHRSRLQEVSRQQNVGSTCRKLQFYNLDQADNEFFLLNRELANIYVRYGYKELYDAICTEWEGSYYRVCLIGNAGTGKSIFQLFALKQLLQQQEHERKYDLVVRQVESRIAVIDLTQVAVFRWDIETVDFRWFSRTLKRTLYFFEPGSDATRSPLEVFIPSLSTLSPCERRIKEYSKSNMKRLYFWPWSFSEMWAVVLHSELSLDLDDFTERYKSFGGIIRNVLGQDGNAREKLDDRLTNGIDFNILTAKALNVDRLDSSGTTVSGFLVCYNHRWNEGSIDFSKKNLEYTSMEVEDAVLNQLWQRKPKENVNGVLRRLHGEIIDLSGKMLKSAAMQLLSCGTTYKWQACAVGEDSWVKLTGVVKRKITRTFTIDRNYTQGKLILAPTNTNFPAVDFVFSNQNEDLPVVVFQCTWQKTHPLTVRALYEFRCVQMGIQDAQIVNIYLISPNNETCYQSKTKSAFLDGSLAEDLQWTKTQPVPAHRLQAMWNSTNIHILRPEKPWEETLTQWLARGNTGKRPRAGTPESDSKPKSRPRT